MSEQQDVYTILVVDDHAIVREGLQHVVTQEIDGCEIRFHGVATEREALEYFEHQQPDLVITDVTLKDAGSGLHLTKELIKLRPDQKILVISMHEEAEFAVRALRSGAKGYLPKEKMVADIKKAIRIILFCDGVYFSPEVKNHLILTAVGMEHEERKGLSSLSDREREVFGLLARGMSFKKIAETMEITTKTVETYAHKIKAALGLGSHAELRARAVASAAPDLDQGENVGE